MVQYVFTPWRDRRELLLVRHQFYPTRATEPGEAVTASGSDAGLGSESAAGSNRTARAAPEVGLEGGETRRRRSQHHAVDRVSMWVQRGNCPHVVESTALLMAAVLSDEEKQCREGFNVGIGSDMFAVRAAYSAAFSRFVTGLLDGHQDKLRKQSMYSIAKTIGLPATFVELRHQSTHEQLPSLAKLRVAAKKALDWIWDYFWEQLPADEQPLRDQGDGITQMVMKYLQEEEETAQQRLLLKLSKYEREEVIGKTRKLQLSLLGNRAFIKCAKLLAELRKEMPAAPEETPEAAAAATAAAIATVAAKPKEKDEEKATRCMEVEQDDGTKAEVQAQKDTDCGWMAYQDRWIPKPIGMV